MLLLVLTIIIFSIIQSIFGVGLLVFGTPSLMLMGKSYEEALSIVLPCSLAISVSQVVTSKTLVKSFKTRFLLITLPMVAIGLYFVLVHGIKIHLSKLLGSVMIFTAFIRFNRRLQAYLKIIFKKFSFLYLAVLGLIHGMTNMGGGLLTIYSSTIVEGKNESRSIVSYAYMVFAILQISILIILKRFIFIEKNLSLVILSLLCFLVIGQKIYAKTSDVLYQKILSFIILCYGLILLLK